jgi:hypothetical protein
MAAPAPMGVPNTKRPTKKPVGLTEYLSLSSEMEETQTMLSQATAGLRDNLFCPHAYCNNKHEFFITTIDGLLKKIRKSANIGAVCFIISTVNRIIIWRFICWAMASN